MKKLDKAQKAQFWGLKSWGQVVQALRAPLDLHLKEQCIVYVVMTKCMNLLQREYIGSHTGQWSVC